MDVRMPGLDGVEATRLITDADGDAGCIILTTFDLDEYVYAGLRAGASGFLLKDAQPADLLVGDPRRGRRRCRGRAARHPAAVVDVRAPPARRRASRAPERRAVCES